MAANDESLTRPSDWRRVPEKGTILGIRILLFLATVAGRRVTSAVLWIIAAYYVLVSARVRRASKAYLARVGERPTLRAVVRHVHTFARVGLDRAFFLRGRTELFEIDRTGPEHLADLNERRAGAILLGSHLGSFEAMRAVGRNEGLAVSIVVDARSAERVGRVLRALSPHSTVRVIAVEGDGLSTALRIREAVQRGELVSILADRRAESGERNVVVDFLGAPASFPAGPFLVAHALKCPVYLVFGLFRPPNRYSLSCEPFADAIQLDRARRDESLREHVQRYADRLGEHVRRAPYNWFNFYDFWSE